MIDAKNYRELKSGELMKLSEQLTKLDVQMERIAAGNHAYNESWEVIGKARGVVNNLIRDRLDENIRESEGSKVLDKNRRSVLK